ncbi:MAG TPA: NAD(P)H-hydrate dehydratase [Jatrophihabitans sp.]|nr:NAD(P)H-hydrate dehydratase [Jatrophihabitans sp.]
MTPTPAEPTVLVTPAVLRNWRLPQPRGSKHSRGHVLVAGGSPSTPGAAMLAGLAALRVGAGVLALATAQSAATGTAIALPEAAVHGLAFLDGASDDGDAARLDKLLPGQTTVLVGPGIDDPDHAERLVRAVVDAADEDATVVLDAFALGVLPGMDGLEPLAGRTVLTPNAKEGARLLERSADEVEDADLGELAARIAARYGVVVSLEGSVAAPDGRCWTVDAGHPGLGTSGSGDVLAGAVAGLLARGADPAQAACWATYLHATAGDRLASRVGRLGFLAREIVDELPLVLVQAEA